MKIFHKCRVTIFFLIFLNRFQTIVFLNNDDFINRIVHLNRAHIDVSYVKKYFFIKIEASERLLIKNEHEISINEKFDDFAKFYENQKIAVSWDYRCFQNFHHAFHFILDRNDRYWNCHFTTIFQYQHLLVVIYHHSLRIQDIEFEKKINLQFINDVILIAKSCLNRSVVKKFLHEKLKIYIFQRIQHCIIYATYSHWLWHSFHLNLRSLDK